MRELVIHRDSWVGSTVLEGSRSSGVQQQCRIEKDAVLVRADQAACQAGPPGRERP